MTMSHRGLAAQSLTGLLLFGFISANGQAAAAAESFWDMFNFAGSIGPGGHERYVPPLSNPLFNETPHITTEIRPIYFYQKIPDDFPTGGGNIDVVAAEVRIALTETFGIIASKDGYAWADFDSGLEDDSGFANISIGFKYAFLSDPTAGAIATFGVEYEVPIGGIETSGIRLQGGGDGFVDIFLAGEKVYNEGMLAGWAFQANAGVNLAIDTDYDTSIFHGSLHADYELFPGFYPLAEVNLFAPVDHGNRIAGEFDGVDLLHFGSTDRETAVTGALGFRYRFMENLIGGVGYEHFLTDDDFSTMDYRIYTDLVIHF